jgi:TolA-binding protein
MARRGCILPAVLAVLWACGAAADVTTGRLALEDGFYVLADRELLDSLDKSDPTDAALAAHYILRSHYEQARFDRLGEDLDRFAAAGVLAAEAHVYWQGVLHVGREDWAGASAVLGGVKAAAARKSVYVRPSLRLKALAHFKMGDAGTAAAVYEKLDATYSDAPARAVNRLEWGRALLAAGEPVAAQKVWQPLLVATNLPPNLAEDAAYWAGQAYLLTGDAARSAGLLHPLAVNPDLAEPRRVQVATALAEALRRTGDAAGGTAVLTNTLAAIRNPSFKVQTEFELARHLLEAGELEPAAARVHAFVAAHPGEPLAPRLLFRLGEALLAGGRHAGAGDVFQRHLEAFGDNSGQVYRGKAMAMAGQARHAEAALLFERAADLHTDRQLAGDSRFRAGDNYFANRQYRRALETYQRVRTDLADGSRPDGSPPDRELLALATRAWFQCAASLAALGETADAIQTFETLTRTYPDSPDAGEALLAIGDLQLESGQLDAAEAAFVRVMGGWPASPMFWKALHGRGMVRYRRWAPDAIEDFERIAAEAPGTAMAEHAHFMRAMCLYRLGRDGQALVICRDFMTRFPASEWAAPVQFWVARLEYNAGNDEAAEAAFLTFVQTYPAHELAPQALLRAGLAGLRRQQYLQAIELLGRMAKQYPQSDLLADARFHQAEAMVQLGRFAAAILVYEEVINNYPGRDLAAMALGRKGDCQFTLGAEDPARYEEAALSYQALLQTPGLKVDDALQAAYKLGLTHEKLGRDEAALEQYYSGVMLPYLVEKEKGGIPGEPARVWFSRAARGAAAIVERRQDWRRLVRILDRAATADVEFSAEAKARIKTVKSDYWWMFY